MITVDEINKDKEMDYKYITIKNITEEADVYLLALPPAISIILILLPLVKLRSIYLYSLSS